MEAWLNYVLKHGVAQVELQILNLRLEIIGQLAGGVDNVSDVETLEELFAALRGEPVTEVQPWDDQRRVEGHVHGDLAAMHPLFTAFASGEFCDVYCFLI